MDLLCEPAKEHPEEKDHAIRLPGGRGELGGGPADSERQVPQPVPVAPAVKIHATDTGSARSECWPGSTRPGCPSRRPVAVGILVTVPAAVVVAVGVLRVRAVADLVAVVLAVVVGVLVAGQRAQPVLAQVRQTVAVYVGLSVRRRPGVELGRRLPGLDMPSPSQSELLASAGAAPPADRTRASSAAVPAQRVEVTGAPDDRPRAAGHVAPRYGRGSRGCATLQRSDAAVAAAQRRPEQPDLRVDGAES